MICEQKPSKVRCLKVFFIFAFFYALTLALHAEELSKPLWTPEHVVTQPEVTIMGISDTGKYTLLQISYTILKDEEVEGYSKCIVINNDNLTQITMVGSQGYSCIQSQLIGAGNLFSYLIKDKEKLALFVQDIISEEATKVQEIKKGSLYDYAFAPDGKSFAFTLLEYPRENLKAIAGKEPTIKQTLFLQKVSQNFQAVGEPQQLISPALNMNNPFVPSSYVWSPDSQKIAFTASKPVWKSQSQIGLYILDIKQEKTEKIDEGKGFLAHLTFSSDGQKIAFLKGSGAGDQKIPLKPFQKDKGTSIEIISLKTKDRTSLTDDIVNIVGWIEGDTKLIIRKRHRTQVPLYSFDLETKISKRLDTPETPCINDTALSQNGKYIGFSGESLHHPAEIYVANFHFFAPKRISFIHEGTNLSKIQARPLTWKSFDGLEIEGILILPQEYKKGEKVPLIVSVHGGPAGFDAEQFIGGMWFGSYSPAVFASLGYATLTVNFRGSIGYGREFQALDYKDLGGGDFKDIMAGVDFLISQGIVDPDQLFIRGHSYGGFMTAWAVSQTNRFKAASMEAGVADWISDSALSEAPPVMEGYFGGAYWENYKLWRESSPLTHVNNINTPTLILAGFQDTRVPSSQAK
ncbi:MAG: prolyl oligopeptidase family serine peptidase [Alphaproteobacteria bacterium]|nr:prolyl oligopeptidase family serine peptidase [Alphaproteobacteria bacterium]